jgi:putative tricarboxylic transport membrane protein
VRRADVVTAALLAGLAVVVIGEGVRLRIGWGTDGPQPGFFVFYLGVALLVAAGVILVQAWRRPDQALYRHPFLTRERAVPVAKVLGPAAALIVLTHLIGLYVAGGLYLGTYMRWIGRHSWILIVLLGVGVPVATFLVFEVWFLVPLPKGPLEGYLGY